MKLNKKLELGIKAVEALKNREAFTRTADIAQQIGTTTPFLELVMRDLRTAGIVNVRRGHGGGYVLNPEAGAITAYRVAVAVGREFGGNLDEANTSDRLRQSILEAFQKVTI